VTGRWLWPASGARTGRRDLAAETTRRLTLDHCDTGFFSGDGTTSLCDTTLIDRRSQTMIWPPTLAPEWSPPPRPPAGDEELAFDSCAKCEPRDQSDVDLLSTWLSRDGHSVYLTYKGMEAHQEWRLERWRPASAGGVGKLERLAAERPGSFERVLTASGDGEVVVTADGTTAGGGRGLAARGANPDRVLAKGEGPAREARGGRIRERINRRALSADNGDLMTRAARAWILLAILPAVLFGCTTLGRPSPMDERPNALPGGGRAVRLLHVDSAQGVIGSLAGHGATLHFTQLNAGTNDDQIWAIPKKGGPAVQLLARETIETAPVFDGEFAYFLGAGGQLLRARLDGGAAEVLVTASTIDSALAPGTARNRSGRLRGARNDRSLLLPEVMAVDDEFVYWIDQAGDAAMKVAKTGGQPIALAAGLEQLTGRVFLDGAHAYMLSRGSLLLLQKAAAGPAEVLPARPAHPRAFAVTDGRVLWMVSHRLFQLSPAGVPAPLEIANVPSSASELDIAGDAIFYAVAGTTDGPPGYVSGQSLPTGAMHKLSNGHIHPGALVVDRDAVYFVELGFEEQLKGERRREQCCTIWWTAR